MKFSFSTANSSPIMQNYGFCSPAKAKDPAKCIIPPVGELSTSRGQGDFHGELVYKTYCAQVLLRESINSNDQERLKELIRTMVRKVITGEIPIISLMANGIKSDKIKEYLVVQATTSQPETSQPETSRPETSQAATKTLIGDESSVSFSIGNQGDLNTLHAVNKKQVQDYWKNNIISRISAYISNDYSPFNNPKSENYIMGHNHPDGSEPSNQDLRAGGLALSLVFTQNSVYFIDYKSELENLDKLQALFMKDNKALTSACLETQQEANSDKIGVKQQESNSRIQHASRLLSCNIKTYQESSEDDPLKPFNPLQVKLINQSLNLSEENHLLQASMKKILSTPEALQIFGNALELYSKRMPNNSYSDFKKILKEALVEVFNTQLIFQLDKLNNNPQAINSEILTNLPSPKELAAAIISGDRKFFNRSTLLDSHSDLGYGREKDAAYYDSLKEKFGVSVARIPLKEILDEEDYTQFQYKKAEFVRDLFLDDSYSEFNEARKFWINSFVPLDINEGIKVMNSFNDGSLLQLLAEKTVKVLAVDDKGAITVYQNLDSDRKKIIFLSALWKESHSIVDKLNEVVSNEELKGFNNNLGELCVGDCVRCYIKTFRERLDFDTSHLKQINYISCKDEGYAIDLIDSIGESLKKKGSQIDENLYEFFISGGIKDKYKEQLAALLPIQEGGNEYSAKLAEFSTRKHMSSVLRQILQDKCPPLEFKSLALPKISPNHSFTDQSPSNSDDPLSKIISEFELIATSAGAINAETIKELAILAPQYLLTEFPDKFILATNSKEKYSSHLVARLRGIDPMHFKTEDFHLIKTAFLEYLNTNKAKYERKIEEYKDDSILKGIMGTKLKETINQINFFENPTNS